MAKKCFVTLNNCAVTVVRYDDIEIQFPSIHKNAEYVYVDYDGERYSIVDEPVDIKCTTKKKSATKKTTAKQED